MCSRMKQPNGCQTERTSDEIKTRMNIWTPNLVNVHSELLRSCTVANAEVMNN